MLQNEISARDLKKIIDSIEISIENIISKIADGKFGNYNIAINELLCNRFHVNPSTLERVTSIPTRRKFGCILYMDHHSIIVAP